jgi:hypothetical protein
MCGLRVLFVTIVGSLSCSAFVSLAQQNHGGPSSASPIEVTDARGIKHKLVDYNNGSRFLDAGLPFDDNITDDYKVSSKGFWARATGLRTVVAVELHTPEEQAKIHEVNVRRGMTREFDFTQTHAILLVPLRSLDTIAFTIQKSGENAHTSSVIHLAGGDSFSGGSGFGALKGKENVGSLGLADFSIDLSEVKSIRSVGPTVPFVGDFAFFGTAQTPFRAKVTDAAGDVTTLKKALYCTTSQFSVPNNKDNAFVTYGDVELTTVKFSSSLAVKVGGTSALSIPPSRLRSINLNLTGDWYTAAATLRTGERLDLTIETDGAPSGILGASSKGWVWVPWLAIASVEYEDK